MINLIYCVIFICGVSFSISHAIVPKSDAEIIKHLTEIYFAYLYWVSIIWIVFCIIDVIRHRYKVQMPKGTLNRLDSIQTSCYADTARIGQKKLILTSPETTPESMAAPYIKITVLDEPEKDRLNGTNDLRVETDSDQVFIENEETISSCDNRIKSNSLDDSENQSVVAKPLIDTTRDILTRRRALDLTAKHDLQAYVRHRRCSIVQHVIGYNYDDNSTVGGLYTRVGIGIFCLGTVIHASLSILSNLENFSCIRWTAAIDDFSRLLFTFIQFFFVFKHSNLIIRAHESVARLAVIHIVVTNLCVWFRMVVIETISEIAEVDGHEVTLMQASNISNHIDHGSHDTMKLIYQLLLIRSDCSHLAANGLKVNHFIREGYLRLKPLLYPCTIEFSLMCLTLFFLIWENVGKTFPHKMSDKESTKNVFMVNCHASVKGLFAGMICFSCTIVATLLYAIFRNKIGDSLHTMSPSSPVIHHKHSNVTPTRTETILHRSHEMPSVLTDSMSAVYQPLAPIPNTLKKIDYSIAILEIVNLCLLTLSLCATIWALIKIRKLNYRRTTTRFDDVLIIVSLTGIYLYSIFSAFAIISNLSSSTWVAYVKVAIIILEFVEGTIHALFILLALRKRLKHTSKHKYPAREIITLLIMLDLSLWFEKTTTSTKHQANPFQLAFYHVIPWSIITAIAMPLQIFFRFHASVCLSHVWANMYHLPPYEPIALRDF
ncbi:unnamed protein product [Rotaria socialis]|uniref:Uncharacterized protein n=1 Tax=Rotaria socialis TaxID=392032 RepID=A0A820PV21_9BILA|nr:unnamed protein product [Rotaria socialis]